ncbi:UNKNOWN [Stylonychia lemnae]|uniref:Uncharacterized protein n=1 Tax=Stylonychia lemnae TaxID=5949 RepID=A0A078AFS9_STYLE|nr:UNKNOWN [Stylonychia lemnae]|eukprot:CDW81089.1 UNKNOWN [Stylonychia lemnae]
MGVRVKIGEKSANHKPDTVSKVTLDGKIYQRMVFSFGRYSKDLSDKQDIHYSVGQKDNYSREAKIKGFSDQQDLKLIILSNIDGEEETNTLSLLKSAYNKMGDLKDKSNVLVVDITNQGGSDMKIIKYLDLIQPITMNYPYIVLNFNKESQFSKLFKPQERQISESLRAIQIFNTNIILAYSQDILQNKQALTDRQKGDTLGILWRPHSHNIMILDRPIYCSSLNDACTSDAMVIKNAYLEFINKGQLDLIISGRGEYYERTFPKYEFKHTESEDPTKFINPEYPIYININGPKIASKSDEWTFQKQQWSAFIRKIRTFGQLTITAGLLNKVELTYNQYNDNGTEVDQLTILKQIAIESNFEVVTFKGLFIFGFLILAFIIVALLKQFEDYQKIFKDIIIENKPYPIDELRSIAEVEETQYTQKLKPKKKGSKQRDSGDELGEEDEDSISGIEMTELTHRTTTSSQQSYTNLNDRQKAEKLRKTIEDRINDNEDGTREDDEIQQLASKKRNKKYVD